MILQQPDDTTLTRFQRGDTQALNRIYHFYYNQLCYFAHRFVSDQQAAEDIVTDCFIKLWEKHSNFSNLNHIKSFLFVSTKNACLNFIKQARIANESQKKLAVLDIENPDLVLNEQIEAEVLQAIYLEVENLPAQCRQVFKLLFYKGMPTTEIASQLGLSVQTVRNQKTKALQHLKLALLKKNIDISLVLTLFSLLHNKPIH